MTTLLEAIYTAHRITCQICKSYSELSAANYTKFEAARMLDSIGWQVVNGVVLCPSCVADWNQEQKQD